MPAIFNALPGIEVPVSGIARGLADMWRDAAARGSAAPGADDVTATQVNFVLHLGSRCTPDDALRQFETTVRFSRRYPSRVVVLCPRFSEIDAPEMRAGQEATVRRLWEASRRNRLEFLLEIIPSKVGAVDDMTTARLIRQFYAAGVYPDWWKLEPMTSRAAWANAIEAIEANDRDTRGIVVLGLDAPEAELAASFRTAAGFDLVKGFAVGRTIFADAARAWMQGETDDATAVDEMARRYGRLCGLWDKARASATEAVA